MLDPKALEAAARADCAYESQGGVCGPESLAAHTKFARPVVTAYLAALPDSDETVERVARAMWEATVEQRSADEPPWDEAEVAGAGDLMDNYRTMARAALRALTEDTP